VRLDPRRAVLWAAALGAAALVDPVLRLLGSPHPLHTLIAVPSTIWLSLVVVRRALKADSTHAAAVACMVGGILAGALNQGVVLSLLGVWYQPFTVPVLLFLGTLIGFFFLGGPLGFAFGLGYAALAAAGVRATRHPSHLGRIDVMRRTGAWLALVGLANLASARGPHLWAGALAVAVGLALVVGAAGHDRRVSEWARRLVRGEEPGWRIVPRRWTDEEEALLPLARHETVELHDGLLVEACDTEGGPYRATARETPVAVCALDLKGLAKARALCATGGAVFAGFVLLLALAALLLGPAAGVPGGYDGW
jgi:hypothetical protein